MPRLRLTKTALERLRAPHQDGKTTAYWDTELKGFGVLVSGTTNRKTYIVQYEVADEVHHPADKRRGRKPREVGKIARKSSKHTERKAIGPANVFELEEAVQAAKGILSAAWSGKNPKPSRRGTMDDTLREWVERYLESSNKLSDGSREEYRATFGTNPDSKRGYLKGWLDLPLRSITASMVSARHKAVREEVVAAVTQRAKEAETRRRKQRQQKPKSNAVVAVSEFPAPPNRVQVNGKSAANSAMRALSAVWNFAARRLVSEGVSNFPPNPVQRLEDDGAWHKIGRRERDVSFDDLPRFYAAVQKLDNEIARDYITFLLFTGTRRREAASLEWDNVDFGAKEVHFPAARTKSGRALALPMTDIVLDLLVARRGKAEGKFIFPAISTKDKDPKTNLPVAVPIAEPKFHFGQIYKATGIYVSPHDLRRTFVSVAVDAGISGNQLKALVNHARSDSDVTAGYVTSMRLREPAQRVADRMKALCGITAVDDKKVTKLKRSVKAL